MSDERRGLPSASILARLYKCPGSWHKAKGLPDLARPETEEWAETGNRIHLWLESPDLVELTADEMKVADRTIEQRDKLVYQIYPNWANEGGTIFTERRLWLESQVSFHQLFSGQNDFSAVAQDGKSALIVDYKSNRGEHESSESNLQLRAQAVLLWVFLDRKPDLIHVAIVQPLVSKPVLCAYDRASLEASEEQVRDILAKADAPDAPLVPGKAQCQYCPARLQCDVAWKESVGAVAEKNAAFQDAAGLSKMLDQWALAKVIGKDLEHRAKELLKQNPAAIPNWGLKPTGATRTIPDPYALYNALHRAHLVKSPNDFIKRFCKVGIGDLEKTLTKEVVADVAGPLIKSDDKDPSLKRL